MDVIIVTNAAPHCEPVLPAIELLPYRIRKVNDAASLLHPQIDLVAVLVDARNDLAEARANCRLLHDSRIRAPVIAVLTEGGLAAVQPDWQVDDVIVTHAGPAEVEARLRLMSSASESTRNGRILNTGYLTIDLDTYSAKLHNQPLNLTYKEFELLRFLAQNPGRVFSREQLLRDVWGHDYFGGARTVDVHVRRLRAKLGSEHEGLIATVRQVGYKFNVPRSKAAPSRHRPSLSRH